MSTGKQQIPLDLGHVCAMGREDYFVSQSNQEVVAWLDKWPDWPSPALIVHGPKASGKTHLFKAWEAQHRVLTISDMPVDINEISVLYRSANHFAIDDIDLNIFEDNQKEQALFHLYNLLKNEGGTMLLMAQQRPADWNIGLPDLASRLKSCLSVEIKQPDDALLAAVLVKLFSDRQVRISHEVVMYLLHRIGRSMEAVYQLVDQIDHEALAQKRKISIPFIKSILEGE